MHHVTLDRWSRGTSRLHSVEARAKIIALLAFLVALGTTPASAVIRTALFTAVALAGIFIARLPFWGVLARAAAVLPFCVTFAMITWFAGDRARAVALIEKPYISAIAVLVVAGATPLPALLQGFARLGAPRVLTSVIQFLYRYLFVISEQAQHMRLAAVSRAGFSRAGRRKRFDAAAGALSVLFGRSYYRAGGIYRAMLARGYNGDLPVAHAGGFRIADGAFAACVVMVVTGVRLLPLPY